ncbi:hypothetical protein [Alicyclobacillus fastidiosus]|uniref:hypothetical protein n=1 Tax=Alicyclobacillus fastidiosus TaxID=392011 RepID=UPI0034DCED02
MKCLKIHLQHAKDDLIFKTGFRRVDGKDVPLGTCSGRTTSKSSDLYKPLNAN